MTKTDAFRIAICIGLMFLSAKTLDAQMKSADNAKVITISNNELLVNISTYGAELQNIISQKTNHEYLWQGNPEYYGRHAPILFPFIGRLWEGGYNLDGKRYSMMGHGFAKDEIFELAKKDDSEAWFKLTSNKQTMEIYPFPFELTIGYILENNRLKVVWDVKNTGNAEMYFMIGGHPAFNYPDFDKKDRYHTYLGFDQISEVLSYVNKDSTGYLNPDRTANVISLDNDGLFPVSQELFKKDAVIFENYQARKVTMYDKNKNKYLAIEFDMPVFTLWSSPNKKAPFICIEPLYGRIEEYNFIKDMRHREWTQNVSPGERFLTSHEIAIF